MITNNIKQTRRGMHTCSFCGPGITHIIDPSIYPNDVVAEQDKSGKWKCGTCQERDVQDVIVRAAPNSPRAKEIVAEHTAEVSRHNEAARRLNQISGHEAMKVLSCHFVSARKSRTII